MPEVPVNQRVLYEPCSNCLLPPTLKRIAVTFTATIAPDLDANCVVFDSKGKGLEVLSFARPMSKDMHVNHQDRRSDSYAYNQSFTMDLDKMDGRTFALSFVLSSFHDNLSSLAQLRVRLVQQYQRGIEMLEKDVFVYVFPNIGDGASRKLAMKSSSLVVANLYRNTAEGTWTFRTENTYEERAVNNAMVQAARRCLHAGLPAFSLPEDGLIISRINDIATYIRPSTLDILQTLFPPGGFKIDDFVSVMVDVLLEDMPELNSIEQVSRLVGLLRDLFCQIDVHADGLLMWNEFTDYCVEAGLQVLATVQCASDREYEYRTGRLTRLADNIRCGRLVYKAMTHSCAPRVVCMPELSSTVNFLTPATLTITEQICAERYEFVSQYGKNTMTNVDTLVVVHDVEYVPELSQIFVASSNTSISRWEVKKGNTYKWITNMYPGDAVEKAVPMATLLWVPSHGRQGELTSVGTDHRLYIWDVDKGMISHSFERAHREHVSSLVSFSSLSRTVATSSFDHTVVVWDIENRVKKDKLQMPYPPKKISYSDERLLTVGPKVSNVWDATSMAQICTLNVIGESEEEEDNVLVGGALLTFVDSGEGHQTRAIVGDYQNNFHVWNVTVAESAADARPELLQTFSIKDAGFGHLKDFVLVEHKKYVWPDIYAMGSGRELVTMEPFHLTNSSLPIAISLYNPVVDSLAGISGTGFKVWDMQTSEEMLSHDNAAPAEITVAMFDEPLYRKIYLGCSNGHVIVQNYLSGKPLAPSVKLHKAAITYIKYYFPAKQFVTAAADRTMKVSRDDINGKISVIRSLENVHPDGSISSACINEMFGFIASASSNSQVIRVWDYETFSLERELLEGHEGDILAMATMTGYPAFVSADSHGDLLVWATQRQGKKRLRGFRVVAILTATHVPGDSSVVTSIVTHSDSQHREKQAELTKSTEMVDEDAAIEKAAAEAKKAIEAIEASVRTEGLTSNDPAKGSSTATIKGSAPESTGAEDDPLQHLEDYDVEVDEEAEALEDMPGLVIQIAVFDTSGMVYTWDAARIMRKMKCRPVQEVHSRNPSFRIHRDAAVENPASVYESKLEPTKVRSFDNALSWQAHYEPIISGCFLDESLVITASMDLSLRLYANAACVVGANKYPAKSKLGEVNLLDGDEARVSRKEHWVRPSMDAHLKHKASCRHAAVELLSELQEKKSRATSAEGGTGGDDFSLASSSSFLTEAPSAAPSAMSHSLSLPSLSGSQFTAASNATAARCQEAQRPKTPRRRPKGAEVDKSLPAKEARKLKRRLAQLEAIVGEKEDNEGSWRCTANTKSSGGSVIYTKLFAELGRNKYVPVLQSKVDTNPSGFLANKLPEVAEREARRERRRERRQRKGEAILKQQEDARRNGTLGDPTGDPIGLFQGDTGSSLDEGRSFDEWSSGGDSLSVATQGRRGGRGGGGRGGPQRRGGDGGGGRCPFRGNESGMQGEAAASQFFVDDGEVEDGRFMGEDEMNLLRQRWALTQDRYQGIVDAQEEDEKSLQSGNKKPLSITTKGLERARTPSRKAVMSQGEEPFSPSNDKDPHNFGSVSEDQLIELARYVDLERIRSEEEPFLIFFFFYFPTYLSTPSLILAFNRRLIRVIDKDGDGKVNVNEFQALKREVAGDSMLKSLTFEFIDRDHSGFITISEFVQLTFPVATREQWSRMTRFIKKFNTKTTDSRPTSRVATKEQAKEAKAVFAAVDVDESGSVTASELFDYLEKADKEVDGRPLALSRDDIAKFIAAHDEDSNQMLDENEFVDFFVNIHA
jgi:WD40 repeat protein/Ca2+-binding EF-hand superfamily protein/stress response protein SCP2